jgi:hypothetical protein
MDFPDPYHESLVRQLEDEQVERTAPVCRACGGSGEQHYLASPPDPQTRMDYRCGACGGSGICEDYEMPAGGVPAPAGGRAVAPVARPPASSVSATSAPPAADTLGSAGNARPAPAEPCLAASGGPGEPSVPYGQAARMDVARSPISGCAGQPAATTAPA